MNSVRLQHPHSPSTAFFNQTPIPSPFGLPFDLFIKIVEDFTLTDMDSALLVCQNWRAAILDQPTIWQNLFKRVHPEISFGKIKDRDSYVFHSNLLKEIYVSDLVGDYFQVDYSYQLKTLLIPKKFAVTGNHQEEMGSYLKRSDRQFFVKSIDLEQNATLLMIGVDKNLSKKTSISKSGQFFEADRDGIYVWDLSLGRYETLSLQESCKKYFTDDQCLTLMCYNQQLISAHQSGTILLWDAQGSYSVIRKRLKDEENFQYWEDGSLQTVNDQLVAIFSRGPTEQEVGIYDLEKSLLIQESKLVSKSELNDLMKGIYNRQPYSEMLDCNAAFGYEEETKEGHRGAIISVIFEADKFFTSGEDTKIKVWDSNNKCLATLKKISHKLQDAPSQIIPDIQLWGKKLFAVIPMDIIDSCYHVYIKFWDFGAHGLDVFEDIASEFEEITIGLSEQNPLQIKYSPYDRFSRMSLCARRRVYEDFSQILQSRFTKHFLGKCRFDPLAFYDQFQLLTDLEKTEAIETNKKLGLDVEELCRLFEMCCNLESVQNFFSKKFDDLDKSVAVLFESDADLNKQKAQAIRNSIVRCRSTS